MIELREHAADAHSHMKEVVMQLDGMEVGSRALS